MYSGELLVVFVLAWPHGDVSVPSIAPPYFS